MNAAMTTRCKDTPRLIWGFTVLLVFVALGAASALINSRQPEPPANKGMLDLSNWDFDKYGSLLLADGWEWYRDRLMGPEDFGNAGGLPDDYVRMPHNMGFRLNAGGEQATYRIRINLGREQASTQKALWLQSRRSDYRVYINGHLSRDSRVPGGGADPAINAVHPSILVFPVMEGINDIIVQVSDSTFQKGGLRASFSFGEPLKVHQFRELGVNRRIAVMSALAILGTYHLALFWMRKNDWMSLMISIACFLMSIRMLVWNDGVLTSVFPDLAAVWSKLEYFTLYAGIPFLMATIRLLYPQEISRLVTKAVWLVSGSLALSVLVLPAYLHIYTFIPFLMFLLAVLVYSAVALAVAGMRGRTGARINTISALIMILAVINDILLEQGWIQSIPLIGISVFLFAFVETMVVAQRYTKAYVDGEKVSGQLAQLNQQLEEKIRERTEALEITNAHLVYANDYLHQLETARRELIANITHELGTPMTSIQGYMKALLDGVIQPEKQYIQLLYDKIQMADRLVQDLFDLTKLEEGQTTFHMVDVIVDDLFNEDFSSFQWDVENQGIRFQLIKPESTQDGLPIARIDPIRIRQVITNLVHNALNYTEEGGTITIRGEYGRNRLVIQVTDTGKGIDPQLLPHIFDRFVKGSGKKRSARDGSGLGLAIAREIVMHHGGILTVDSEYGKGSTFQFDIPIEFIPMVVD